MKPHQERVIAEKTELDAKRGRLAAFRGTDAWLALDGAEQLRLDRQQQAMNEYAAILAERIAAFPS